VTEQSWLIDKSALARLVASPDAGDWSTRIERGLVHVTTATILEVGYSAQSPSEWSDRVEAPPLSSMPVANLTPVGERRAVEVQRLLARAGQHRAPSVADLLVAAAAELDGLIVLHVDKDFDLIANITDQRVERLRTAG
jgi:predicted nucleic acid-binding protein